MNDTTIHEADYEFDPDNYDPNMQYPNLLAFMLNEQWVCSDNDLNRAIEIIARAQQARAKAATR